MDRLKQEAIKITNRFYKNLGIDVNDPNWDGLMMSVWTVLNTERKQIFDGVLNSCISLMIKSDKIYSAVDCYNEIIKERDNPMNVEEQLEETKYNQLTTDIIDELNNLFIVDPTIDKQMFEVIKKCLSKANI